MKDESIPDLPRIDGIIGTSVLEQFIPTLDYPGNKLIVRKKTAENRSQVYEEYAGQRGKTIPFYLDSLHLLFAKGSINGSNNLLFFVDSGLADDESHNAFIMAKQTFTNLNIKLPEVKEYKDAQTGAGVGVEHRGYFQVDSIGFAGLERHNMTGVYTKGTEDSYLEQGFIQDALISHNYLKQYIWTIDFDSMNMIFAR